jgi:hypothetical protein
MNANKRQSRNDNWSPQVKSSSGQGASLSRSCASKRLNVHRVAEHFNSQLFGHLLCAGVDHGRDYHQPIGLAVVALLVATGRALEGVHSGLVDRGLQLAEKQEIMLDEVSSHWLRRDDGDGRLFSGSCLGAGMDTLQPQLGYDAKPPCVEVAGGGAIRHFGIRVARLVWDVYPISRPNALACPTGNL